VIDTRGRKLEVHMTAIGGVGMTALAGLLSEIGHRVRGSDLDVYPPASDELERLGVAVARGYRAENLEPRPDLVVMGNAISAGNPEAVAARIEGVPTVSLPEALALFCLADRMPLVVAGTHGKTTSTAFLAWVLRIAGRDPGYFIGGAPIDLPRAWALGSGREFALEGDEYDSAYFDKGPKFLHYRPEAVVLTAVEFDHADIYRDLSHVKEAFARLLTILPVDAPLLVCADFEHAAEVARASGRSYATFSDRSGSDASWRALGLDDGPQGLRFRAAGPSESIAIESPLLGAMNVRNLLGVIALARALDVPAEAIREAAASFRGVKRRQQVVARGRAVLIDDFAHHPTAIAATLAGVRGRFPGARLWALFDPRSNTSRRRVFQQDIAAALAGADRVIVGPVHDWAKLSEEERFSPERAVKDIRDLGRAATVATDHAAIVTTVRAELRDGDVVVALSNGAFGGVVVALSGDPAFAGP
jgi:UDP-N-acetylmuramate: L-alanyl-gamma-D-glutamyl-meso-diaminopimelate ligase